MMDFMNLRRRLEDKMKEPRERAVTYVAFGDSVTQGCMEYNVIEYRRVFHHVLKRRLEERYPNTILNVINSGVSGDSITRSAERWERDLFRYDPDFVTLCFGLNDVHEGLGKLEEFRGTLIRLIRLLRTRTGTDILLMTPNGMMTRDNDSIHTEHRHFVPAFLEIARRGDLKRYVDAIRQTADDEKVPLLDLYAVWEKMGSTGMDIHTRLCNGINHPDREFHEQIASLIEEMVTDS